MKIDLDWQSMSLAERDAAYNNTGHVGTAFADRKNGEWDAASAELRNQRARFLDLPYGSKERNKWDLYPAIDPNTPCLIYIHGGYWQRGSRERFACLMEGVLAHGWSAALPGYTLAPEASLTQIVSELRIALGWFSQRRIEYGMKGPIILSGWSAGGHLAAFFADHPMIAATLAISGVYDLSPLSEIPHVNDALKFAKEEIVPLSPLRIEPAKKTVDIAYGTAELPAMMKSSLDYFAYRQSKKLPGKLIPVEGANHFTILDELRKPDGMLTSAALKLVKNYG
jgi:arylformamidase